MKNNFDVFGIMLDCSRNAVMNIPSLERFIDILADLGYNTLMLYTEDTFEVDGQPYFGHLRGKYSKDEIRHIDAYAAKKGVTLMPAIQTLAHLGTIFRWDGYRAIRDRDDILLAGDERTYQLIDDIFSSLEQTYTSRVVNIGLDEAHMLGRGRYQDIHGFEDRFDILLNHLNRVCEIAKNHGFECLMWGDMFFRLVGDGYGADSNAVIPEGVREQIPDNVTLVYWDYYSTDKQNYVKRIKKHNALKDDCWFAGGYWSWAGFAPHNDYSIDATNAALSACIEEGTRNVLLTMWGDNGADCGAFSLLPSIYYGSELARGNSDMESIKKGFYDKYGIAFDDFMLCDLPNTPNDAKNTVLNPEKYMLYSDCLMGIFDSTVREGDAESYKACAERLRRIEDNADFGYIFKSYRTLCDVLALKFDIGTKTRAAYKAGDKKALSELLPVYDALAAAVKEFYEAYRARWMRESKPQGFEIQDARLGGLYFRIRNCRDRIADYTSGKVTVLEELEESALRSFAQGPTFYNSWAGSISAGQVEDFLYQWQY